MTDEDKWNFLKHAPELDASHPQIEKLARELMTAADGDTKRFLLLAHTVARDFIRQTSDVNRTGGEDIAGLTRPPTPDDPVDALRRGEDDCDAKARLFVALCLAAHIQARMVPRWSPAPVSETTPKGRTLTHVSAEARLGDHFLPVELTLSRARLGEQGENVPKEIATGHWKLA